MPARSAPTAWHPVPAASPLAHAHAAPERKSPAPDTLSAVALRSGAQSPPVATARRPHRPALLPHLAGVHRSLRRADPSLPPLQRNTSQEAQTDIRPQVLPLRWIRRSAPTIIAR